MSGKVLKAGSRGLGNLGMLEVKVKSNTNAFGQVFILFSLIKSEKLPGWDVANYLNVVNSVQRESKGHTCRDDHLQIKTWKHSINIVN